MSTRPESNFRYGDIDIFRSPYTFKNDYTTDFSQDFGTEFGGTTRDAIKTNDKDTQQLVNEKTEDNNAGASTVGDENTEEIPSWSEFTENTTFHGIKYVFQTGFKFRR